MSSVALIDIGVNLTNSAFAADLDQVLARASAAGVTRMVVTGTSAAESAHAAELAATRPAMLRATAGVHPHHASECEQPGGDPLAQLRALAARPEIAAIGECGLDYNRNFSPPAVQRRWFEAQLELAIDLRMPLFLHERDATDDMLAIVRRHHARLPPAVIHCFTGTADALDAYLELDLHIGITGWVCDERRGTGLAEIVHTIPGERLMIETDAPYLIPRTIRPRPKTRRNEPAHLPYVVAKLAACRDEDPDALAAATTATAERFFDFSPAA
ncbi:TatD family hydrolase [Haliangium ochraceum]|uniref:TatD-related deoxyribonuclease n=1 Tax=Haliangium ochraceum (strain DSM 14365 / JCM 11303 / SMP-2) TaxID=502025 RepID=D0LRF7_HALO1|nr:TatD family hydrolase [Haliangium ochraceum]ACY17185.1 TatD-related deoxyribonuclease [Haliangium ochraceum DSM 14365]